MARTAMPKLGNRTRPGQGLVIRVLSACLVLMVAIGTKAMADTQLSESKVKALYIYNLVRYTDWPPAVFSQTNSPIHLLIVGADSVAADLRLAVAGKIVQGRPLEVETASGPPLKPSIHLLFLGESEKAEFKDWLAEADHRPILTVAENDSFLPIGGMVCFHMEEGKVKLAVNLKPVKQAGLSLSSRLLAVATEVRGRE